MARVKRCSPLRRRAFAAFAAVRMKYGDTFVRSMRRSLRIKKSKSVSLTTSSSNGDVIANSGVIAGGGRKSGEYEVTVQRLVSYHGEEMCVDGPVHERLVDAPRTCRERYVEYNERCVDGGVHERLIDGPRSGATAPKTPYTPRGNERLVGDDPPRTPAVTPLPTPSRAPMPASTKSTLFTPRASTITSNFRRNFARKSHVLTNTFHKRLTTYRSEVVLTRSPKVGELKMRTPSVTKSTFNKLSGEPNNNTIKAKKGEA